MITRWGIARLKPMASHEVRLEIYGEHAPSGLVCPDRFSVIGDRDPRISSHKGFTDRDVAAGILPVS